MLIYNRIALQCVFIYYSFWQEYNMMIFLRMQWNDERLSFYDFANFTRIELTGDMVDRIWTPDVFITNERKVDPHSFVKHENLAYIENNGRVSFSMRYT